MHNMEKEAKEKETNSSPTLSTKSKYKGKAILESTTRTQPSQMIKTPHKGEEFMKTIENISSQLHTQIEEVEPHLKKKNTQLLPEQVQLQQAPATDPREVPKEEHPVPPM